MKTHALMTAAILLAFAPAAYAGTTASRLAPPAQVSPAEQARIKVLLQQAVNKAQTDDITGARADLTRITESPAIAGAPADMRYWTYYMLAACEREQGDYDAAYDHAVKAGQASPAQREDSYWFLMVGLSWRLDKGADLVDAVTHLVQEYPQAAPDLSSEAIYAALREAKDLPDASAKRLAILEGLRRLNYKSNNIYSGEEGLWSDLFELYAEAGDDAKARDILASLTKPGSLMPLYIDKRYQRFVDLSQATDHYKAAQTAAVTESRRLKAEHPRDIEAVLYLAFTLDDAGQAPEALNLLDEALAKVAAAPKDKPAFDDLEDQLHWAVNTRSRMLHRLGRDDEYLAAQIRSRDEAAKTETDTVSQRINLGDTYYVLGRPKEAIEAVAGISKTDDASPYGLMAAEEVRACAYQQLGDQAKLATSLAYMRNHAKDGYGPLRSALLCVGDEDGLAKLMIAQLDDPDTRLSALTDLQIYLPEPHPTPIETQQRAHFAKVRDRADVRTAVDKYGVILSWPTWSGNN